MVHGDAALPGQGIVAETALLANLPRFTVGGTVHVVCNNQIGFTTTPRDGRSSPYSSDVFKTIGAPILCVNAEEPEAMLAVARIATEYRTKFGRDIVIELIGYRRHGHNELDEPAFTQPGMYSCIRSRPSIVKLYGDKLKANKVLDDAFATSVAEQQAAAYEAAYAEVKTYKATTDTLKGKWAGLEQNGDTSVSPATGIAEADLKRVGLASVAVPEGYCILSYC